jgi:hypothetical protein
MGVLQGARYHVHGRSNSDDAGKLGAMKVARPVWRGVHANLLERSGKAAGAYPTTERSWQQKRLTTVVIFSTCN